MQHHISVVPHSNSPSLLTNRCNFRSTNFLRAVNKHLQINIFLQIHFTRHSLKNKPFLTFIWIGKFYFSVQSSRPEQGRVQRVGSVRCHNHHHVSAFVEAIHLSQQLYKNTLHLSVSSCLRVVPLRSDRVNLVYKNNTRRVFLGHSKDVSDHSRALSQKFLHKFASHNFNKRCLCVVSNSFGYHRLSCPWGAIQKHSSWRVNAQLCVQFRSL